MRSKKYFSYRRKFFLIENALQAEPFPGGNEKKYIVYEKPKIKNYDSLREELNNFVNSILNIER